MTKSELITAVAEKMDISKKDASECIDTVFSVIGNALVDGDLITVRNFGPFKTVDVPESNRFNPRTMEPVTVPAHKKVRFVVANALKDAVR